MINLVHNLLKQYNYIMDQSRSFLISSLLAMLLLDGSALYMDGYPNGFLVASTTFICFPVSFSHSVSVFNGRRFFSGVKFSSIDSIPFLIKSDENKGNLNFINDKNLEVVLSDYLKKSITPRWYPNSNKIIFKEEFFYQDLLDVYTTISSFFLKNKGNSYILNINFHVDSNDFNAIKMYDLDKPVFSLNRSMIFYIVKYILNSEFFGLIEENHLLEITRPADVSVSFIPETGSLQGFDYQFFFSTVPEMSMSLEQLEKCKKKFPFLINSSGLNIEQLENSVKVFMINFIKKVMAYYFLINGSDLLVKFKPSVYPSNFFGDGTALPYNSSSNIIFESGLLLLELKFKKILIDIEKNYLSDLLKILDNLVQVDNFFFYPSCLSITLEKDKNLFLFINSHMFKIYGENTNLLEILNNGFSNTVMPINLKLFLESYHGGVARSGTFSLLSYKDMSSIVDRSNLIKKINANDVTSDGITIHYDVNPDSLQDLIKKFK